MPTTPLVNGHRYSFASIELVINGRPISGFTEITYKDSVERGKIHGKGSKPIGRAIGKYECEASCKLYKTDHQELIAALGPGFGKVAFDVTVTYGEDGEPTTTDTLVGCMIDENDVNNSQGTDGLMVSLKLNPMEVLWNGISMIRKEASQ